MMREVTVAALMCFTLGGSGGAAQNLDGEGLSEGEAEAVWLQPRKLMKVVEGTSHEVQWFTMLPDVASVTAQVEDQTVARVEAVGSVMQGFSEDNFTFTGFVNVSASFLGYNKLLIVLYDSQDDIAGNAELPMSVLLAYQNLSDMFILIIGVLLAFLYMVMGATLDLEVIKMIVKKPLGPMVGIVCQYIFMPLVTAQEIHELMSNQEETDTRIVLYLKYAAKIGYKSAVVRTPDTVICVILLFYASSIALTIFIDIGIGKHRKIVNVSEMEESMGVDKCSLVLGLYVFTGEDVTSSFKGKGKVGPLKMLERNPKYHEAFRKLGDEWSVKPEVIDDIEAFTCLMYGYSQQTSIDAVRGIMLRKMVGENEKLTTKSKVDLLRLPPCRNNLSSHIGRVNHRIAIYKRAHIPIFWCPKPYDPGQGWEKNDKDILEPVWSCGPVLPPSLMDLVESTT